MKCTYKVNGDGAWGRLIPPTSPGRTCGDTNTKKKKKKKKKKKGIKKECSSFCKSCFFENNFIMRTNPTD
jgi:hypothetical protein